MPRPRDNQKSRLYASEWEVFGWPKMEFKDMAQLEDYFWKVMENHHVQKRYQAARDAVAGVTNIHIANGAGFRRAMTIWEEDRIRVAFPRKLRTKWVVLHEIAHVLSPMDAAYHGREFCQVYLHLIKLFFGAETEKQLKAGMKKHNCKYSKSHSPYKRPLTQEEKDAMLARLLKNK